MSKYLIIGNSAAAVGCIEGIRQRDKNGSITVLSSEKRHTYSRPLISYYLAGKTDIERMKYRPNDFYDRNGVKLKLGATAVKVEPEKKEVVLLDGSREGYKKLLVATGSRPFVPTFEGLESVKRRYTFMSLDDALLLEKVLTSSDRVLIVGAGLIGLKCAEGIKNRVKEITVCDIAKRVLPSILDERCAVKVQRHLEENGIRFYLGNSVERFDGERVIFQNGEAESFDAIITAVGVRPNTALIEEAGGEVDKGIVVNERQETSLKDIYCAGDCSKGTDMLLGEKRILALLPNAYLGGECAGINMAGGDSLFQNAIPMNAIGFFGLHIVSAGVYDGEEYLKDEDGSLKLLYYKDDVLRGFILIGDVARAGIYTSLIRNKTPLSTIDFELIKKKPQLAAFAKKDRAEMLSHV